MNELTTNVKFSVDFTPSTIEIKNEEQLSALVNKAVEHYGSLVFTDGNVSEAKTARADLNKVKTMLDDQRKAVKKDYNKPLKEFEDKIKTLTTKIDDTAKQIDSGIKDFEEREKQKRSEKMDELLNEMAPNYNIDLNEFEIDPSWLNKGAFTTKGEVSNKTLKAISERMLLIQQEKQRKEADKQIIFDYAVAKGLEGESWVGWIEKGQSTMDVKEMIDKAVNEREERLKLEQKAREQEEEERRKREEYEQAMAELKQRSVGDVVIDEDTGEIVDPVKSELVVENETTYILKITGTYEQLQDLNAYMFDKGLTVEKYKG